MNENRAEVFQPRIGIIMKRLKHQRLIPEHFNLSTLTFNLDPIIRGS